MHSGLRNQVSRANSIRGANRTTVRRILQYFSVIGLRFYELSLSAEISHCISMLKSTDFLLKRCII